MKTYPLGIKYILAGGALALATLLAPAAEQKVRFEAAPSGHKVQIDGDSTIHKWTVIGQVISGFVEFDPAIATDPAKAIAAKPTVEVSIPAKSLKSTVSTGATKMNNVMLEALKVQGAKNAFMKYKLLEMTLKEPPKSPEGPFLLDTKGELTVSGVTRTNAMLVKMERVDKDKLKFSGSTAMKMTDFNVKPPSIIGLLNTADDIKVAVEWLTVRAAAPAAAEAK